MIFAPFLLCNHMLLSWDRLTCVVWNLHISFLCFGTIYLYSCSAVTVSYLKWTMSKGKSHISEQTVKHMMLICFQGQRDSGGLGGRLNFSPHHTLLGYPSLYFVLVSESLTITSHSFIPISVFTPLTAPKCMHTKPTVKQCFFSSNGWKLFCNHDIKDH